MIRDREREKKREREREIERERERERDSGNKVTPRLFSKEYQSFPTKSISTK